MWPRVGNSKVLDRDFLMNNHILFEQCKPNWKALRASSTLIFANLNYIWQKISINYNNTIRVVRLKMFPCLNFFPILFAGRRSLTFLYSFYAVSI